jgi:glycosidase
MKKNYSISILMIAFFSFSFSHFTYAQSIEVYPTNWWVGMKWNKVQLLIRSNDSNFYKNKISINYPGVSITSTHNFENGKYVAVNINIAATAKPGSVNIQFANATKTYAVLWQLKQRREGNGTKFAQGITSSDFIYLLMPDRFSNGDTTNDRVAGMLDQSLNRDSIYTRHGGDLQGVINHLDYLQSLGVTTLWMTPVLENDMPKRTEHGYAFTDHYKIEPRFGGAEMYKKLSDEVHKRGMKLIQDAVYNHIGSYNFIVKDGPAKDWLHQWPTYTQTNYKDQTVFDPYGAPSEKKILTDGWFTKEMPDLNQSNPYVANFLIQHAIWCVEEFGVDGWRIDTYIYNDLAFMNNCNKALVDEYPHITMFGETWVHGTANQAYFADNNINTTFKSNLQGPTDFQCLFYGIIPALNDKFGWTDGVNKLYETLSNDFLYKNPMRNCIFLDNHDLSRIFSVVGEDINKDKMGFEWLLTSRGIPEMYYGDEVLMKGFSNPDGLVRSDFPGGWKNDSMNAFTGKNLDSAQTAMQSFIKTLGNFRKNSSAIKTGKMMQYLPVDGLYVYFRYDENETVMCVMNTNDKEMKIDFNKYAERTTGFSTAKNIVDNSVLKTSEHTSIPAKTMWILELKK